MSTLIRLFTVHPASTGQSYLTHAPFAIGVSLRLLVAAIAALLHALFPFLFQRLTNTIIEGLHAEILRGRARAARP